MPQTILLVEDDRSLRLALKGWVKEYGHTVIEASDGQEGWEKFQAQRPKLVITDLNMPRLDGLALTAKIKDLAPETFIIIFTALETGVIGSRANLVLRKNNQEDMAKLLDFLSALT